MIKLLNFVNFVSSVSLVSSVSTGSGANIINNAKGGLQLKIKQLTQRGYSMQQCRPTTMVQEGVNSDNSLMSGTTNWLPPNIHGLKCRVAKAS